MKRGITCIVLTAAIIGVMWLRSPLRSYQLRPTVSTITAETKNIYDSVLARGSVEDAVSSQIRLDQSARIDAVHISLGDQVTAGETLFDVSQAKQGFSGAESVLSLVPELSAGNTEALAALSEISDIGDYGDLFTQFYAPKAADAAVELTPEISAPISGVVTELAVQEGDIAAGQSVLATVSDFSALQVRVSVPELYISKIRVGQTAEITGEGFAGKTLLGKVSKISPTAKQKSNLTGSGETTVDVFLTVDTNTNVLRPGYSVSAKIYTDSRQDAVVVPYGCVLQDEGEKEFVYVENGGKIYRKAVLTGFELDDEVEIRSGVDRGEHVVFNPGENLTHGMTVRIQEGE